MVFPLLNLPSVRFQDGIVHRSGNTRRGKLHSTGDGLALQKTSFSIGHLLRRQGWIRADCGGKCELENECRQTRTFEW